MDFILWAMVATCVAFLACLLYTKQFKWLLGVIRNMALGIIGILSLNMLLAGFGLAVGVNIITTLIVGLLGVPGFILLYASQLLL